MAVASTFNARDASAYERSMGRWSRRLAASFTAFAGLEPGDRVLDVGCGPGSLLFHLADSPQAPRVTGIDASPVYVAAAREKATGRAIAAGRTIVIEEGDAGALAFADSTFDRVFCQLVLQFIPGPARAVAEMARVARPGGTIAAAVWASGGGMVAQRMFFDTAAQLDPAAKALRAHTFTRPVTRRGELAALFRGQGLREVVEDSVTIWMEHAGFDDYWGPLLAGEGTLGMYVGGLTQEARQLLERNLRDAYLCGEADGPRAFSATALVCRGIKSA